MKLTFIDESGKAHNSFTEEPEYQVYNNIGYIKFDGMPFDLRESILHHPNYDPSKIQFLNRSCGCGKAAFIEEEHFNKLTNNFNSGNNYGALNLGC